MRLPWLLLAGLALTLVSPLGPALPGVPARAQAAEYRMITAATYTAHPVRHRLAVEVNINFTNTTPNPPGAFSVFEVIDLAVQPGAARIRARDGRGDLRAATDRQGGFTRVTVRLRNPVRFHERARVTLRYQLRDAASRAIRVSPSIIIVPAWSFGTRGTVRVNLPPTYEVRIAGSRMSAKTDADGVHLNSGTIGDPSGWLAQLTATRSSSYATASGDVRLQGGSIELTVNAWADDAAWGRQTRDLLVRALPKLERELGLDYPSAAPLLVVETVADTEGLALGEPAGAGGTGTDAAALQIAFDASPFTVLHQAAHLWLSDRLAADRWIREGFASQAAAAIAGDLDVSAPYQPGERARQLGDDAFPLISWGAGRSTPAQDAYGYAASWAVADRLAAAVGPRGLSLAWRRMAADVGAYDPLGDAPARRGPPAVPIDSRRLLDQLEAVSAEPLTGIFREEVFDEGAAPELTARSAARTSYAGLVDRAGEWGTPEPVRDDLAAWRFDAAVAKMQEATAWLAERDDLRAEIAAAGLTEPARLRDAYVSGGGELQARAELDTEAVIVRDYAAAVERAAQPRGTLERLGLLGGPEPSTLLAGANAAFGEGDLTSAAELVDQARTQVDGAATGGLVRIGSAVALVIGGLVLAFVLLRRRAGTGYTAAP
jgi:hypothetical protein